jgi:hypothetical protein
VEREEGEASQLNRFGGGSGLLLSFFSIMDSKKLEMIWGYDTLIHLADNLRSNVVMV